MKKLFIMAIVSIVVITTMGTSAKASSVYLPIVTTQTKSYNSLTASEVSSLLNYLFLVSMDGDTRNDYGVDFAEDSMESKKLTQLADVIASKVQNESSFGIRVMEWEVADDLTIWLDDNGNEVSAADATHYIETKLPSAQVKQLLDAADYVITTGNCRMTETLIGYPTIQDTTAGILEIICGRIN
jgi:hypothetical protein